MQKHERVTGKSISRLASLAMVVLSASMLFFSAMPAWASEVLTVTDQLRFEMDQPKSIWTNNEDNDNSQFRLDFKEDLINIEIGENVGGYEPLGAFVSAVPEFTRATRTSDFSAGSPVCLPPSIDQDGVCFECPTGSSYDVGASTVLGEAICSSNVHNPPIETTTTPSFDVDQCPAGFKPVGLFSDECYSCPAGYSLDGSVCKKTVSANTQAVSCPSGARQALDGSCISCSDYSGYGFNSVGTTCTRAKDTKKMSDVGNRTRYCKNYVPATFLTPGFCATYSYKNYTTSNYTIASGSNLYRCTDGYTHNVLVGFNNDGICEKTFSDKTPYSVAGCPTNSINIAGTCFSCPSGSSFDGATSCIASSNAQFAEPDELLCGSGEFWDPLKPNRCFSCGPNEVRDVITNTCKPLVEMVRSDTQRGLCPGTATVDGNEVETFPDFFASNPGCFSCPADSIRTLSSVDSDQACFGMNYDAADGVEVGYQLDYGLGFRWGIGGGMVADGGSVDVTYEADVHVDVVPLESGRFQINTAQDENSIASTIESTSPGFTFYLSAHNEGYAKVTSTMKYLDFDESTGLPIPRQDVAVLIDADTDGTNRDGTTREIGPFGYGEANEEFLKFAVTPLDGNLRLFIDQQDWSAALGKFNKSEGTKLIYNPLQIPPGYCPPPQIAVPGSVCNGVETADTLAKFPLLSSPPADDFNGEYLFDITPSYSGSDTIISDSVRAGDRSGFKNLFANGSELTDLFEVDRTAGTKDPDFFRFDFDLDGAFTLNSGVPLGLVTRKFKPALPPKKPSILYELSGDVLDMKAALILSLERNLSFVPNLEVTLFFSAPVLIGDNDEAVESITIAVGDSIEFSHPGNDLSITTAYSVANNDFTNDTNLNLEPLISGKAIAVGWKLPFPTPTLPKEVSAVKYSVDVADQPLTVLHLNFHDQIFSGKQEATFSLGGFSQQSGSSSLLVAAPNNAPVAVCQDVTLQANANGVATLEANSIDAGSSDPDGDVVTLSLDRTSFSCAQTGATLVVLSVTDTFGVVSSCSANVTVQAQPLSIQAADQVLEATSHQGALVQIPTSIGGGCLATSGSVQPSEGVYPIGTHTFTVSATDEAGTTATSMLDVVVQDTTPPVLSNVDNLVVDEGTDISVNQLGAVTVVDAADPTPTVSHTDRSMLGDSGVLSVVERIWVATDASGNSASVNQFITVLDKTPPVITLLGESNLQLEAGLNYVDAGATAQDQLDGDVSNKIRVTGLPEQNPPSVGQYTIRYNVMDGGNNAAAEVSRTLTVADTIAPVITLLGDSAVTVEAGSDFNPSGAQASDSVSGDLSDDIVVTGLPIDTLVVGEYVVQYLVADASGNESSANVIVTVVDTTAPDFAPIENETITLSAQQRVAEYQMPLRQAQDVVDGMLDVDCGAPTRLLEVGTTTIACSVADSMGNIVTQSYEVTVIDNTPPALVSPSNVTVEFGADVTPAVLGSATANDTVDGLITANFSDERLGREGLELDAQVVEVIQRTWTSVDLSGNTSTEVQVIQLVDTTAPILFVPIDASLFVGDSTDPSSTGNATANDFYDNNVSISFSDTSVAGEELVVEVIQRVWQAVDGVGNVATGTQTVTVSEPDTQPSASILASSLSGTIPFNVVIEADVESGNGPLDIQWLIDDVSYSTSSVQLTLETAGTVNVQLSVTDINGDVSMAAVVLEATLVPIDDLLAEIEVLRQSRQALKVSDQAAQAEHKAQVDDLRANIRDERAAQKARREASKQVVASLRASRKATKDSDEKIQLGDQISAEYAGRQASALLSLQRVQSLQDQIRALRQERQVERQAQISNVLAINAQISAIRLEIRQRQTDSTAERDLVDQEIFELQAQRRALREQQSLQKLETRDGVSLLQDAGQLVQLNLKMAQKAKSDEIRVVRGLLRREQDKASKTSLKNEIAALKTENSALRDAAQHEMQQIQAEIALIRQGSQLANANHKVAQQALKDQIQALRNVR